MRGNTLSPFDPLSETCDFSQIQWIKSQKWLTLTDSPAYHCVVQSFSYWIVLKVLAAIQFRSRGEWRNLPYFAISQAFRHCEVQKDCQNRKREIEYMPLENCPFPKIAYFQSLFFHVNMVLTQRRRETRRWTWTYLLSAMFWRDLWNVRNLESGIRNVEFAIFQILTC